MKISYYIPKGKQSYKRFLDKEIALAPNIKDKNMRTSISSGLKKIRAQATDGKAYFWDGEELFVVDYFGKSGQYRCDREFFIDPLKIGKKSRYLLVVMDANDCIIGELRGKRIVKLWKESSHVPRKHDAGGQSQARFERARSESLKHWMKKVGHKVMGYVR